MRSNATQRPLAARQISSSSFHHLIDKPFHPFYRNSLKRLRNIRSQESLPKRDLTLVGCTTNRSHQFYTDMNGGQPGVVRRYIQETTTGHHDSDAHSARQRLCRTPAAGVPTRIHRWREQGPIPQTRTLPRGRAEFEVLIVQFGSPRVILINPNSDCLYVKTK